MKLSGVLSAVNQIERSKFLTYIEKIFDEVKEDKEFIKNNKLIDLHLRSASGSEINKIFKSVYKYYQDKVKDELDLSSTQVLLLINILSRDGNNVARVSWIEDLYDSEREKIVNLSNEIQPYLEQEPEEDQGFDLHRKLNVYHGCLAEAYNNDARSNLDKKISKDERSVLNVLAQKLGLSDDHKAAVEHRVVEIPATGVAEALESLREIGLIFISRKHQLVYIPNEMVEILHEYKNKELADKFVLRVLRTFSDAELSNVLKNNGKRIRSVPREDKIREIINSGFSIQKIFYSDMHNDGISVNDKKDRLKDLIDDLDLDLDRIGSTLEERSGFIIEAFKSSAEREFNSLSASGYKELFSYLCRAFPEIKQKIGDDFELDKRDIAELSVEKLRSLGVTPYDLVYLFNRDEIRSVREDIGVSNRGNVRLSIIEKFANEVDKLIESYEFLATRDLQELKNRGVLVSEADLGIKFEEATKSILEQLDLNVDEELRKSINNSRNQADIVISLGNDDLIICEVKSYKSGEFAKYSTTSRQVKSYVSHYEKHDKRIAQVLIIAPAFSTDFIEASQMDTDVNISLLEAKGLKAIFDRYKAKRSPQFSVNLLTKGGLLKADLIAKNI